MRMTASEGTRKASRPLSIGCNHPKVEGQSCLNCQTVNPGGLPTPQRKPVFRNPEFLQQRAS